jgi:hypothetical protein
MTSFRILAVSAVAILSVGWLQADTLPTDPLIKFTASGDATSIVCTTSGCPTSLLPVIGPDGFVDIGVTNGTTMTITSLEFFIPTSNFDQFFSASTNLFTQALILPNETAGMLEVVFSGTGNALTGGAFTLPPDPTDPGSGALGFVPGGQVTVNAFFAPPAQTCSGGSPCFTGLLPGETGTLALSTPEPSTFWLSLSCVVGLLAARRKLRKA